MCVRGSKLAAIATIAIVASWSSFLASAAAQGLDPATLAAWSAPYRNWHYQSNYVIPPNPAIPGYAAFGSPDVPTVYQVPSDNKWYMSFIAFNGQGYNSFVEQSTDLLHWSNPQLAMGFGKPGEFDYGGTVVGAYLYQSYDIKAPRVLKTYQDRYWTLYGAYPHQGGYELAPGYNGVASSNNGLTWQNAKNTFILSVNDPDVGQWEKASIYMPWLVEQNGTYYDFYNASGGNSEQIGIATSTDLLNWSRYTGSPVIQNGNSVYDTHMASDPKVYRDGDHWDMFYFGLGNNGHADIMIAFSRDLLHWTADPEPLYQAGGNPGGIDATYAHKISLVFNPADDRFYLYYCAVGPTGRGIGLITSDPVPMPEPSAIAMLASTLTALLAYAGYTRKRKLWTTR